MATGGEGGDVQTQAPVCHSDWGGACVLLAASRHDAGHRAQLLQFMCGVRRPTAGQHPQGGQGCCSARAKEGKGSGGLPRWALIGAGRGGGGVHQGCVSMPLGTSGWTYLFAFLRRESFTWLNPNNRGAVFSLKEGPYCSAVSRLENGPVWSYRAGMQ